MSVIGSNILAGASGQGGSYNLTRSLRFRRSASAFLNRTPSSTTSRTTWTWSSWVKRGQLGVTQTLFSAGDATGSIFYNRIVFDSNDRLSFYNYPDTTATSSGFGWLTSTAVYRDPSAWYHVVCIWDSANATSSNRMRMFVNGVQVTSFISDGFSPTYPNQNTNSLVNSNSYVHRIGQTESGNSGLLDGYLAEVNFIDGQALTPSSFGQTSPTTGVWQPKKYAGAYGTNGFYLPFTNNSTTTTLGNDFSGNGNNWTTNNISLTAGATYDSMTDVPTLTSATASNFAVLNPIDKVGFTIANGNLDITAQSGASGAVGTIALPTSGKYYWENTYLTGTERYWGIINATHTASNLGTVSPTQWVVYGTNAVSNFINKDNSTIQTGLASIPANTVVGIAYDADAGTIQFYNNGSATGTAVSFTTGITYVPWVTSGNTNYNNFSGNTNFGQRPFAYTPPTGFVALNTFNLPTPTIGATASTQANKYFDATIYTGNGSTQTITNSGGFSPDLVWAKVRNAAFSHQIYDAVRGATLRLSSDSTSAEGTVSTGLTAFNSNGFSLGSDGAINGNGNTFVGWQWRGSDSTAVTNTAGSITSTVSANTSSGFSVVTYTGTGANATVGHGLGVAPAMAIIKRRSTSGSNWLVYHKSLTATSALYLNTTEAKQTFSDIWNNTAPTSTVMSLGTTDNCNLNGGTYVGYFFSEVAGYSKFGSYTGNGSSDGPFIFTGFRPKYVMVKLSSAAGENWYVLDSVRNTFNVVNNFLEPNTSLAENEGGSPVTFYDFVSNGFKIRNNGSFVNTSGATYIYMAFAESPFKYSLGR